MTYPETLEFLYSQLPMYQRVGKAAYKQDLNNTIELLEAVGNPHHKFKSIHIAGTNGKGTSAHGIAAILQSNGYTTGLYTSPHLKQFTERIRINGQEIGEQAVVAFVEQIKPHIERIQPSFFEITVAMAFVHFANQGVDIAVIETGLGGRLDSTNVITPEACLITNIGYDHMDLLGDTLEKIAAEKAGIIKMGVPIIIGEYQEETWPVFEKVAKEKGAELKLAELVEWHPSGLVPDYLIKNYAGIRSIIEVMKSLGWNIEGDTIEESIVNMSTLTGLKGRFQVLQEKPLMIADVSHNSDGLKLLFDQIIQMNKGELFLIFGTVKEKELTPIFNRFPNANIIWTSSSVQRALSVEELAIQGVMHGKEGECYQNVNDAIVRAKEKARPEDLILITGSTFVVAEINDL